MTPQTVKSLHQAAQAQLQAGNRQQGKLILEQLLRQYPSYAPASLMLGALCREAGDLPTAINWLNRAIASDPALPDPYFLLGLILYQLRQLPESIVAYRKFLARKPSSGNGLNNLGRVLLDAGQVQEAIQTFHLGIAAAPKNAGLYSNLGDALRVTGDTDAAIAQYHKAISVDNNCAEAHGNLGVCLIKKQEILSAIASIQRAVAINPRLFNARFNLARAYQDVGNLDESVVHARVALELRPDFGECHNLVGNLLGLMGEVTRCVAAQTRAVELQPSHSANHSNLLLTLQYRDDISPQQRFAAHRQWGAQHTAPITANFSIKPVDGRRLRIGYVSPNFQSHSVGYFFEPVLAAHDRTVVEIFLFSNTRLIDDVSHRLRGMADHWRDIVDKTDAAVADLIRQDEIDILIDLAGHTSQGRLQVFGYKPAPVQITWLGYPDTTGMAAIDFRFTDAIADPPGESDALHTEKLIRIDGGCWAYGGPASAPPPVAPPLVANGFITFGSFNNLPKVGSQVLETWATILKQTPDSRMLIKAAGLVGQIGRDYISRHFEQFGVDINRIELLGWAPSTAAHFQLYERVDIALDTFPYNGTTTTCEALWMGVPVVTFAGNRHVARVGVSLLTHGNCAEWIANDLEGYIALATRLASQPDHLTKIRAGLRDRLKASPLCDGVRLARQFEAIFASLVRQ